MTITRIGTFVLTALIPLACSTTDPMRNESGSASYPLTIYAGEEGVWAPAKDVAGKSAQAPGRYLAQGPFAVNLNAVRPSTPSDQAPPGMKQVKDKRIESPVSEEERERMLELSKQLPPNAQAARGLMSKSVTSGMALGPTVGVGFESSDYINSVPPDPELAVGPNHIIATVNSTFTIYNKQGGVLRAQTDFDDFFSGVCTNTFDPNAVYDEDLDRFIIAMDGNGSAYCVAASQTADPTGAWNLYAIPTGPDFFDFPHAGVGRDALYMGANIFSNTGGYLRAEIYAMDKMAMYAGTAAQYVVKNIGSSYFTPQPVKLHGAPQGTWPESGPHYIVSGVYNGKDFHVWAWTDPFGSNSLVRQGSFDMDYATGGVPASNALDQPQQGSMAEIQGNDWRLLDAEYRNGSVWVTHTIACNPGSGSVNCIRWAKIDPTTVSVLDAGILSSDGDYRSFPDLAADACDNMAIGYTKTSSNMYPGVYVAGREAADPGGMLQAETLVKAGELAYTAFDAPPHRWGDYTSMTIDPDGFTFWYLGEYSRNTGSTNGRWGTWINSFTFGCVPPDAPAKVSVNPASVSTLITGGDDDEFVDNCETTTMDFIVRNSGGGPLTNLGIASVTPVSHPNTNITSTIPLVLAASLAEKGTVPASFAFEAVDAAYGDTLTFAVTIYADELAEDKVITLTVSQAETDIQAIVSKTWNFESGLEDWTVVQGTFNPTGGYVASSANQHNQCDQIRSPEVSLQANSTLALSTNYDIEDRSSGRWWDQANVGLVSGSQRSIKDPDGGRLYNANGAGAVCVTAGGNGWASSSTSWAPSTWSASALGAAAAAGDPVHIDVAYGTDGAVVGRGFWFDSVTLTNFTGQGPDAQVDSCSGTNTAPTVNITAPVNTEFYEGESIVFGATAGDAEDGDLSATITWSSSIDGEIGNGAGFGTTDLSSGTHTITASVNDTGGLPGSDSVTVIVNALPVVSIDSFTASPESILTGTSSSLSWSTSNAVTCTASGDWTGDRGTSGSGVSTGTLNDARLYTYTLTCNGAAEGDQASADATVMVNAPPAVTITAFSASPNPVEENAATTLSWSADNATSCTGSGQGWTGPADNATNGSASVTPGAAGAYDYSLSCTGEGAPDSASITVTVNPPPALLHIGDLDGSSVPGSRGRWNAEISILVHDGNDNPASNVIVSASWISGTNGTDTCSTDGSGRCTISKTNLKSNVASVALDIDDVSNGVDSYDPGSNHDPDGDSNGTQITVFQDGGPPAAQITSFTASPESILTGASSSLSWSTSNATSCSASGDWTGVRDLSGSEVVSPGAAGAYTYVLDCAGDGGSDSASVTVTVISATAVAITSFTASPESILTGASSSLSWSTSNAVTCTASGDWTGDRGTSGSGVSTGTLNDARLYTYTLTCNGAAEGDQASADATVMVNASAAITLTGSGIKEKGNVSVTLNWTGASSSQVDIYREGTMIATVDNEIGGSGNYIDNTKGGSPINYQVCEAGNTSTCSDSTSVFF